MPTYARLRIDPAPTYHSVTWRVVREQRPIVGSDQYASMQASLQEQYASMQSSLQATIGGLNATIAATQASLSASESALAASQGQVATLTGSLLASQSQVTSIGAQLSAANAEVGSLEAQLSDALARMGTVAAIVVDNVSPSPGSQVGPMDQIGFRVTDTDKRKVVVWNEQDGAWEVIFNGSVFAPGYQGSSRAASQDGGQSVFTVQRNAPGWTKRPTLQIQPISKTDEEG